MGETGVTRAGSTGCRIAGVLAAALFFAHAAAAAPSADRPYTIANYPVDATAADAVTAKERALADGQSAALRSLLKRLVPVTAYRRLAKLRTINAADYVNGISTRTERNSTTQYIATLDFAFHPDSIRELLRRESIPFVDSQAPLVTVVPVYLAPPAQSGAPAELTEARGKAAWSDAWKGLDLDHALAPIKLVPLKATISADTIKSMRDGDGASLRSLAGDYASELVLLAIAEPDVAAGKLHVTLAGKDAAGAFRLKRSYRMAANDFAYTAELASVVAQGTLDGRWKAVKVRWSPDGPYRPGGRGEPVQLLVEFRSTQQWQEIRRQITETPGVTDVQVGGLSARGADMALRFPGGGAQLADALEVQGLSIRNSGGTWLVRAGN